jgi:hypothetical protein
MVAYDHIRSGREAEGKIVAMRQLAQEAATDFIAWLGYGLA